MPDTPDRPLTRADVERLLALADAATPGPWLVLHELPDSEPGHWCIPICTDSYDTPTHCYGGKGRLANARFIAAARAAVPQLCRALLATWAGGQTG